LTSEKEYGSLSKNEGSVEISVSSVEAELSGGVVQADSKISTISKLMNFFISIIRLSVKGTYYPVQSKA
jgi:hypothetical protein